MAFYAKQFWNQFLKLIKMTKTARHTHTVRNWQQWPKGLHSHVNFCNKMPTHPTPCAGLGNFPFRQIFWLFVAGKSKEICASCLHIVCPVNESTGGQAVQVEDRGNYILIWYYGVFPFLKDISLLTSCSFKLYETHCKYALTQSVFYTGYFQAQQTSLAASESSLLSLVFSKIVILFYFIYLFSFFATLS